MIIGRTRSKLISDVTIDQDIDMLTYKLTGLGAPSAQDDSLRYDRAEIRNQEIKLAADIALSKLEDTVCSKVESAAIAATYTGIIVSDVLRHSNDPIRTTTDTEYTKVKEVLLNADLPVCRLKFSLYLEAADGIGYGKIYRNGSPIGVERVQTEAPIVKYSEDFSGFLSGDLIQVYAYHSTGLKYLGVRFQQFYYSADITHIVGEELATSLDISPISITNQDPE